MPLVWLLACAEPAPLPPSLVPAWQPRGRMVAATGLRGYLVKPQQERAGGVLLLVEQLDETSRGLADALARSGEVALAIDEQTDTARAQAYLLALPEAQSVRQSCHRTRCP